MMTIYYTTLSTKNSTFLPAGHFLLMNVQQEYASSKKNVQSDSLLSFCLRTELK